MIVVIISSGNAEFNLKWRLVFLSICGELKKNSMYAVKKKTPHVIHARILLLAAQTAYWNYLPV